MNRKLMVVLSVAAILAIALPMNGSTFAQGTSPYLRAFPDSDFVDGYRWTPGEAVTLELNGHVYGPVTAAEDGSIGFWTTEDDLAAGDILTMQGEENVVTYMVRALEVTNIDVDAQTVSGTVDGPQTVHVWVGMADVYVDTDEFGNWTADVSPGLISGICGNAEAWGDPTSDSSTIIAWCVPKIPLWRDEFDGSLADGWYWVNENPEEWNLTGSPGALRIYTSPFGTGGENLLLRPVAQGDFSIETRVSFTPDTDFQFAGLVIYQDEGTFLQLGRAFCDIEGPCVGNGIYFDYASGGVSVDGNFATQADNPNNPGDAYLRLERRGNMVRAFYSNDGAAWIIIGDHWIPSDFVVNGVGLTSSQDFFTGGWSVPADFDYFEMTEGWGFLPEGYHDGEAGDVPSWACNANGWAVDPDDRGSNLWVEIFINGVAIADWSHADQYRSDLEEAGLCKGGNCGFSTSLWGQVPAYEPFEVVTYAQDVPSGEWVRLYNSPKTLTCRTYDIYAIDPSTGTTTLLTPNLRETHEFNPSWSPNGKFIAHDVLFDDGSYSVYITNVKTGESTPLAGAENGHYAVWSPNGKWIAFERGTSSYLVPSTGGDAVLIRENGITPDWSPNGKRLVVVDSSDGSLRTVSFGDGIKTETTIAPAGMYPVWSPNGNWIAYELNGDLWKVQVDIHGSPLGEAIQLTSGPAEDGQPTWSPDSTVIAYHSGVDGNWDIWTVPAAGGEGTWLTGRPIFGEYDPSFAKNSYIIGYAGFAPGD